MASSSSSQQSGNGSSTLTEEAVQAVIAELVVDAPSAEIKDCLKTYDFDKTFKQLVNSFNPFGQELLVKTLNYLNIPGRENYVKSANVEHLVCRIQNLLPDTCSICNEAYCVKNTDTMLLSCAICGQEVHHKCLLEKIGTDSLENLTKEAVQNFVNPLGIPDMTYLCKPCRVDCVPNDTAGLKKSSKKVSTPPPALTDTASSPSQSLNSSNTSTPDLNNTNQGLSTDRNSILNQNVSHNNKTVHEGHDAAERNKNGKKDKVCRFFATKSCRHGMKGTDCMYKHPEICNKLLQKGHCPRKSCRFYHPKMCFQSLESGTCQYKNCRFYHVSGTRTVVSTHEDSTLRRENSHTPNSGDDFLDQNVQSLQNLKQDILETMDMRFATLMSCLQSQMNQQRVFSSQSQVHPHQGDDSSVPPHQRDRMISVPPHQRDQMTSVPPHLRDQMASVPPPPHQRDQMASVPPHHNPYQVQNQVLDNRMSEMNHGFNQHHMMNQEIPVQVTQNLNR